MRYLVVAFINTVAVGQTIKTLSRLLNTAFQVSTECDSFGFTPASPSKRSGRLARLPPAEKSK